MRSSQHHTMQIKNKRKVGAGVPIFQRGWKTFAVGPPGQSGEVCLHPWLAAFAYPANDVVQTSHAVKRKYLIGVNSRKCFTTLLFLSQKFLINREIA